MTTVDRKSPRVEDLHSDLERLQGELTRRERDAERLQREKTRLQRKSSRLQRENDRLKQENERLKRQLDEARRAGRRQAEPFAKDRPQGEGKRPGRRAGAKYGRHGCCRLPPRVDEVHAAPVPAACPDCGGAVEVTRVASQYQEELPPVRPVVRRFDIEVGHCSQCRQRVQGRHVLQTSDALGAAAVQLGPGVVALVVELHTELGVPLGKVAHLLRTTFGLQVTPGGLSHVLHRAARAAAPAYTELCEQVRNAPVVTPDETGWRVGGERHWLWVFTTPDTTVYAICPGRGFDDAATVLGTHYAGVLVRDGWAPYRCYDGLHQTCLNHLLQRCRQLQEDHPNSPWAGEVRAVLLAGLDLRDRCNAGELSEHGMATARGRLTARLARLVDAPPPLEDAERFAAHLANEFPAVFLFLWDPSLDATNWRAEQAIRPAVVIRKVCGGNRTRHGADTQQVLASVVRTARQRALDLPPLIAELLRAPEPAVPELLGLPPPTA
ncbi:MAG: IS66 family transposase [Acidobacteria bacterium]|nr:IS66 family transposase [Acidobacteriota bacterium]